jgi:hypothetical protein
MVDHAVSSTMDISLEQLEAELLKLPREVRLHLRAVIDASLDEKDLEKIWAEEANRRYEAYVRGEIEGIPAEEVHARARALLK